jgi:hypothetical protein
VRVHLVNPSALSFGTAVITPRWLFVLAAATPERFGTPIIVDETLERFVRATVSPGDIVGIGVAPRLVTGEQQKAARAGFKPRTPGFSGGWTVHAMGIAVSQ